MAKGQQKLKFEEIHAIGSALINVTAGRRTDTGRIPISWALLDYVNSKIDYYQLYIAPDISAIFFLLF